MNWYKKAQNSWEDFQWDVSGFKYKQCYNCGIFFLPDGRFAYPPDYDPKLDIYPSMNSVFKQLSPDLIQEYLVNKNTISHGLCPKCFIEIMRQDSFDEQTINELLEPQQRNGKWQDLYIS